MNFESDPVIVSAKRTYLKLSNLVILCIVFALLRVSWVLIQGEQHVHCIEDYNIAHNIASGHGFSLGEPAQATALKAPVYPYFLSAIILSSGPYAKVLGASVQHVIMSICPLLLFFVLVPCVGRRIAILSSLVFLFHPSYLVYPSTLEATNLFIPLCLVTVLLLQRSHAIAQFTSAFHWRHVLSIGSCGLLCLTQPLVTPLVLFSLFRVHRTLSRTLVTYGMFLLCLTPWSLRNYNEFHKFIPFKSPVWMNVYMGFNEASHGFSSLNTLNSADAQLVDSLSHVLNDVEMEPYYLRVSQSTIENYPLEYGMKSLVQIIRYWSFPPKYDTEVFHASFIIGRLLPALALFICFVYCLMKRDAPHGELIKNISYVLLYFTLIYAFTHTTNIRFKLDVEWLECLSAGLILHRLLKADTTTAL